LLIVHAWQVHDNRIVLSKDFGFADAEAVDALANSFDGKVKTCLVKWLPRYWPKRDRNATAQVEA
jgi:hypothetical protein